MRQRCVLKRLVLPMLLVAVLALCGCSPKLDVSSAGALEESSAKVLKSLPPEQAGDFQAALALLLSQTLLEAAPAGSDAAGRATAGRLSPDDVSAVFNLAGAQLAKRLHGKTGAEVIALGPQAKVALQAARRQQAIDEADALEQRLARFAMESERVAELPVSGLRIEASAGQRLAVRLTVTNSLPDTIVELSLRFPAETGPTPVGQSAPLHADLRQHPLATGESREILFDVPEHSQPEVSGARPGGRTPTPRVESVQFADGSRLPADEPEQASASRKRLEQLQSSMRRWGSARGVDGGDRN